MKPNIDDPEFQQEIREKYEGMTLTEIIDIITGLGSEEGRFEEANLLRRWTANALGVIPKSEFIEATTKLDKTCEIVEGLEKQLSELKENFMRHRHDFSKGYSEKPSW